MLPAGGEGEGRGGEAINLQVGRIKKYIICSTDCNMDHMTPDHTHLIKGFSRRVVRCGAESAELPGAMCYGQKTVAA